MCEICDWIPHIPSCPNAPQTTRMLKKCSRCEEDIYPGKRYLKTINEYICENCLNEFSIQDWLEITGETLKEA